MSIETALGPTNRRGIMTDNGAKSDKFGGEELNEIEELSAAATQASGLFESLMIRPL
jgi:hypothetical protein